MTSVSSAVKKRRKSRARLRRRPAKEESVLRWVRVARSRGMKERDLVYELHVRRGFGLPKVARLLRVDLKVVRRCWRQHMAERAGAVRPPRIVPPLSVRSEEDVVALREQVCAALWETVVETFAAVPEGKAGAGDANEMEGGAVSPPMMTVRMRALKQMGRLYGVGGKKQRSAKRDAVPVRCATPEEIAESVRERMRGREGRI